MRRALVAVALALGLLGLLSPAALSSPVGATVTRPTAAPQARAARAAAVPVRVGFGGRGRAISPAFFGLSMEYNELPRYEQSGVLFDRVMNMLRSRADGPLTLRIGGKSADHMLWEPTPLSATETRALPPGVFGLGNGWLTKLARLVSQQNLKVILDLNLAVHSPSMAASFAAAARQALPAGDLSALEIGNEPDEYQYQPRLTRERVATTTRATPLHWWSNYTNVDYRRDYKAYARALHGSVPGVALGAPDITQPRPAWLTDLTHLGSLNPSFLAVHRYATSGCFAVGSSAYPTVSNLLNNVNSEGLAASVAPWVRYADARHMGLRVTEINSVSCGHDRGVANSFAAALWAPDALFAMLRAGVNAVSWHIRPGTINAPFHFVGGGLQIEPELYGLDVFSIMTRGPSRLVSSSVSRGPNVHLEAWAVRSGRTVRVLLINKGWQAVSVSLKGLRRARTASVRWLTAPGVHSTGGVRFAGQRIGSDGLWQGRYEVHHVALRGGRYHLRVGAYSAAFVTL
jgi:hypothetical protein